MIKNESWERPVFICGHRKTGTTLLINLFDNHPDLLVYPDDSGFWYVYYPLFDGEDISNDKKREVVLKNLIPRFERNINKPDVIKKEIKFDKEKFAKDFTEIISKTNYSTKEVLVAFAKTINKNVQKKNNFKYWCEKTTSTEIYALEIKKWFPKAKFIHLIRDPRDNWASLKSGWDKRYYKFNDDPRRLLQSLIDRGKLGLELAKHNIEIIGSDSYKVIKFEDLTLKPKDTMKELSEFLDIRFTEELLIPTIIGKPWKGNNFENLEFKKVSSINVNRWPDRIEQKEAMLIEYYFKDIMEYFGYKIKFNIRDQVNAAKDHYKWYNFAQEYSYKPE